MSDIIHPFGGKKISVKTKFCGRDLTIETGQVAFLADGAVSVRYGDCVVLGTVVVAKTSSEGYDYFPMMIDYEERMYAAGKISGSRFIKREARPSERATLAARLIDRPIRPLFPKGFRHDVQGIATVLSVDPNFSTDIIAMIAVSSAMMISPAPFAGPVAGVKVGLLDGKLVPLPTNQELATGKLDLTVAGTRDAIMMVEAGAREVDEATMLEAIELAHKSMRPAIEAQTELAKKLNVKTMEYSLELVDEDLKTRMGTFLQEKLGPAIRHEDHYQRHQALENLREETLTHFAKEGQFGKNAVSMAYEEAVKSEVRRAILDEGFRPDNRKFDAIRPLSSQVGILPRTHGSAVFTRGTTQVINVTTLAPPQYAQMIDTMEEDTSKRYMHHYNFPPYSVGEIRPLRGAGRREIGHGALAERALEPVIPSLEDFPYAIRGVSEVVSSNGSTSMASVCASTLSLMDAGVPITKAVAGIAMGLITDHEKADNYVILSDIAGAEDFAGDMDFKVAGTESGITALQMDIKVKGLSPKLMAEALAQAKRGRDHIMKHLLSVLPKPRPELAPTAPRISKVQIDPQKIREVIGKGGSTINRIIADTGAEIDIQDDGLIFVSSPDQAASNKALEAIAQITAEPEIGQIYEGEVVKTTDFGAFVEILPGKDGMVHISELADHRVEKVEDVVKVGNIIKVKLIDKDERGRLRLSKKAVDSPGGDSRGTAKHEAPRKFESLDQRPPRS